MIKPPFMEALEAQLRQEERIFKFRSGELVENKFILTLLVDHNAYDSVLNDSLKEKILNATKEILPSSFKPIIKYVKANNEESAIIKHVLEFVYKEKPTVYSGMAEAKMEIASESDLITVRITLEKYLYEYATNSTMKSELEEYLESWVIEDVEVDFIAVPNKEESLVVSRPQARASSISTIKISISEYVYGNIATEPRYISDVSEKEVVDVVLCGAVSNVRSKYIEKIQKNLYTFNINDTSGSIKVKYFGKPYIKDEDKDAADLAIEEREKELSEKGRGKSVNKRYNINWEETFVDGTTLVMSGPIKFDNYDKAYVFMPKNIAKCTIDYSSINLKKDFLAAPENYVKVFPKPMETKTQDSLFGFEPNPELKKHVFVVFDLETTGLEATSDEIIEIAAIKIIDGEIRESFECLVNPGISIPKEIVNLTNITDEMVEHSYKISEVIGDFYKFTRDTIMVAHNAPFDMGFISVAGKKNLYDFDNSFIDTLAMSRQTLTAIKRHNLDAVCKHLNISLVGAHRAINDVLATAKVFIELMNRQNH